MGSEPPSIFAQLSTLDEKLIDLLPAAVYVCEAPAGEIRRYNRRAIELWGRKPQTDETEERFCAAFSMHTIRGDRVQPEQSPMAKALSQGTEVRDEEIILERPDGSRVIVLVNIAPLRDETGALIGAVNVFQDITTRKQAEEALRQAEERYRSMVQNAVYGIYRSTPEGRFLDVNPALVRMLGYETVDEVMALDIATDLYCDPEERTKLVERYRQTGHIDGVEVEWKRKDGSPVHLRLSGRAVRDASGALQEFEIIAEDITARWSLEQQLRQAQKMEAIGRLAGGVAHDFNNLMTAVIGYAELLLMRIKHDDPLRQDAEEIKKSGERAAALTNQLLAFSRRQMVQPRVLDVNTVIAGSSKMLRRLIGEDIELATVLDPSLGRVKADPGQIEQVIVNLAVNARDAMPGVGKLTIETKNVFIGEEVARQRIGLQAGQYVMFAVSDTGCGMDPEMQSHIFEPFFTTKEKGKGTGLGLSTVYGIVKQSGGSIWVYSEVGNGSTFKIYLPWIAEPAEVIALAELPSEAPGGSETILLVEDEEVVRRLAHDILRINGYTVLEAASAGDALLHCERHAGPIHLIVTDIIMPQMNGTELAARVSSLRPEMKVLYMSGYADHAVVLNRTLAAGTAFLQKPFTPHLLASKVRETLDGPTKTQVPK